MEQSPNRDLLNLLNLLYYYTVAGPGQREDASVPGGQLQTSEVRLWAAGTKSEPRLSWDEALSHDTVDVRLQQADGQNEGKVNSLGADPGLISHYIKLCMQSMYVSVTFLCGVQGRINHGADWAAAPDPQLR